MANQNSVDKKAKKTDGKAVDVRIVKTKAAIRKAFNELVLEKEMSEISVSELTEKANITRSTFYMYYDSVEAVRDQIENEIIEHIEHILNAQDWKSCMTNPYPFFEAICKEITTYDEYNRYILSSKNTGRLLEKVSDSLVNSFLAQADAENIDTGRAKYVVAFVAAGTCKCFKMWYNHKSSLSLEELCERISLLITQGLEFLRSIEA